MISSKVQQTSYEKPLNDGLYVLEQVQENLKIYAMSYDWTGKMIAVAYSDRTIKLFEKINDEWKRMKEEIRIKKACGQKLKWAYP